jgi:hypothetical protein
MAGDDYYVTQVEHEQLFPWRQTYARYLHVAEAVAEDEAQAAWDGLGGRLKALRREVAVGQAEVKADVADVKSDMKAGQSNAEAGQVEAKAKMEEMKTDVSEMKAGQAEAKADMEKMKADVSEVKALLEKLVAQ